MERGQGDPATGFDRGCGRRSGRGGGIVEAIRTAVYRDKRSGSTVSRTQISQIEQGIGFGLCDELLDNVVILCGFSLEVCILALYGNDWCCVWVGLVTTRGLFGDAR